MRLVGPCLNRDSPPALRAPESYPLDLQASPSIYLRKSVIPNPSPTPFKCKKPTASFTSLACCLCQGLENHLFEM